MPLTQNICVNLGYSLVPYLSKHVGTSTFSRVQAILFDEGPDVEVLAFSFGEDGNVDLFRGANTTLCCFCYSVPAVIRLGGLRQDENGVSVVRCSLLRMRRDVCCVVV